eukprot:3420449-Ditylum_brightwellii.AAC.1
MSAAHMPRSFSAAYVNATLKLSTLALIIKLKPLGSGMLGGNSSSPEKCPNSLEVQSLRSKFPVSRH